MSTFFSTLSDRPLTVQQVMDTYGVDPVNDPERAKAIGVYVATPPPDGYTATHYVREGDTYKAGPSPVSDEELAMVNIIRREHVSLHELELDVVPEWMPDITYATGDHVKHEGKVYQKADDGDNSAPDSVPGGWDLIR